MRYAQLTANLHGRVRREKLQGRDYLVAPLSLIVPGVLNGSQGPLYYPLEEVSKNPEKWNGIPIVVDHPQRNGKFISAKTHQVLNDTCIGMVLGANTKRNKLAAEAWFDVKNCLRINPQILRDVEKGHPREVSTGLHTKNESKQGVFNGVSYSAIARNYTPDHLAILTTDQGACSLKDGCGVNVNQNCGIGSEGFESGNDCAKGKRIAKTLAKSKAQHDEAKRRDEGGLNDKPDQSEGKKAYDRPAKIKPRSSMEEHSSKYGIDDKPDSVSEEEVRKVQERDKKRVHKSKVKKYPAHTTSGQKRMVTVPDNGPPKLDPEKIKKAQETAEKLRKLTGNTDGECQCKNCRKKRKSQSGSGPIDKEPMMAKNKLSDKERKGLVDNLIGNCSCDDAKAWGEEDREVLNALSDEKLTALDKHREAVANALAAKNEEEEEEEEVTTANSEKKQKTDQEWLNEAPAGIRSVVTNAMRWEASRRAALIGTITANESNPFSEKELNAEPTEKLEKLAKAFGTKEHQTEYTPAPLYTGAAVPVGNSRGGSATDIAEFRKRNQDMVPPTVNFKEEAEKRRKQFA